MLQVAPPDGQSYQEHVSAERDVSSYALSNSSSQETDLFVIVCEVLLLCEVETGGLEFVFYLLAHLVGIPQVAEWAEILAIRLWFLYSLV